LDGPFRAAPGIFLNHQKDEQMYSPKMELTGRDQNLETLMIELTDEQRKAAAKARLEYRANVNTFASMDISEGDYVQTRLKDFGYGGYRDGTDPTPIADELHEPITWTGTCGSYRH